MTILRIWLWSDFVEVIILEILAVDLLIHIWWKLAMFLCWFCFGYLFGSINFLLVICYTEPFNFEFGYLFENFYGEIELLQLLVFLLSFNTFIYGLYFKKC